MTTHWAVYLWPMYFYECIFQLFKVYWKSITGEILTSMKSDDTSNLHCPKITGAQQTYDQDHGAVLFVSSYRPFYLFFCFLGPHLWHMEAPRLGVKLGYSCWPTPTATAMPDLSHIFDLHHSSLKCSILNPLSKARDWTCILMDTSWICFHCTTMGTPGPCEIYQTFREELTTIFLKPLWKAIDKRPLLNSS